MHHPILTAHPFRSSPDLPTLDEADLTQFPAGHTAARLHQRHVSTTSSGSYLLLVDADHVIRRQHAVYLRRCGYRIWEAASVREARSLLTYRLPDLVLLELALPDTQGSELIRALREQRRTTLLPIIVVSSLVTPRDIRHGLAVGADDYVTKPTDLLILEARVSALLRRDARMHHAYATVHQPIPPLDPCAMVELN